MNISIILSHLNPGSFTAAELLQRHGHKVSLRDLCQEQFNPLLPVEELPKDAKLEPII